MEQNWMCWEDSLMCLGYPMAFILWYKIISQSRSHGTLLLNENKGITVLHYLQTHWKYVCLNQRSLLTGEIFQNIQHWPQMASSGTHNTNVFTSMGVLLIQSYALWTIPLKIIFGQTLSLTLSKLRISLLSSSKWRSQNSNTKNNTDLISSLVNIL